MYFLPPSQSYCELGGVLGIYSNKFLQEDSNQGCLIIDLVELLPPILEGPLHLIKQTCRPILCILIDIYLSDFRKICFPNIGSQYFVNPAE